MFDMSHDIWEGVGKLELGLLLHQFIKIDKFFDLNFLNERIHFLNYGSVEKINKPSPILIDGSTFKVKENAIKTCTLFRFLPFLIGDKIPKFNKHWYLYLLLSKIVDICSLTQVPISLTVELEWLIQEHHNLFKELFDTTLKPKHHYMVHYLTAIRQLGNLKDFETLRYEAKNVTFKTHAHTIHNCNNIPFSTSKKHQIQCFCTLKSDSFLNNEYELLYYKTKTISQIANDNLKNLLLEKYDENMTILNEIKFRLYGELLSPNMYLVIKNRNQNPDNLITFVKVVEILMINGNILIYCRVYKANFVEHYHSFEISCTIEHLLIETLDIFHHHPFDEILSLEPNEKRVFVRPHCFISKFY